jgi:hypothetical protein
MVAPWRRDLLRGVAFGVPPLVWSWRSSGGAARSELGPCCCQGAQGPWMFEDLSCRAGCSGELDDGWAEEILSVRS